MRVPSRLYYVWYPDIRQWGDYWDTYDDIKNANAFTVRRQAQAVANGRHTCGCGQGVVFAFVREVLK